MGQNKSTDPGAFALAVRAEILAELGRKQVSVIELSRRIPRGKSYLYERLSRADKELTLNDIENICSYLNIPINPIMNKAEKSMALYEQNDYALAAKDVYTGEGEGGVEHYEG